MSIELPVGPYRYLHQRISLAVRLRPSARDWTGPRRRGPPVRHCDPSAAEFAKIVIAVTAAERRRSD